MVKLNKPKTVTIPPAPLPDNPPTPNRDPNKMVYEFLKQNNLRMNIAAVEPDGGFTGDGFILEKKPILKIVFERV